MDSDTRKQKLKELVEEYLQFKQAGKLNLTSEETTRTWLNELLLIFDWNVKDTSEILQEKALSQIEKDKLKKIGRYTCSNLSKKSKHSFSTLFY